MCTFCHRVACECFGAYGTRSRVIHVVGFGGGPKLEANVRRLDPLATEPRYVRNISGTSKTSTMSTDFKRDFDRVWHAALWATMKKYNISTNLIQVIKNLYNKATSAILFNSSIGDWFRTTVGV